MRKIEPLKFENIKLKNINFSYEQSDSSVFKNVNFEINKGEITGLFGESGSEKSTLINLISGLIEPSSVP